jgi:hypothetical protein
MAYGVGGMGGSCSCAVPSYNNVAAILVLFILLAIIASIYNFGF